ncbi:ABC transporter substrate-binding protein [Streptomyces sp. NPDC060194]|uniref:ABC transporter substrate-binding protein n=1 Tax=Streptomyces sp. NPDC060194 TaxID=3347069 RepID=UPI003666B552
MKKITATLTALVALTVAGCGTDDSSSDAARTDDKAGAENKDSTAYPFTLDNCGTEVAYESAPQKVVTLNQTAAEILIRLGVGDRIAGTGYRIEEVPADIAGTYAKIPQLSAKGDTVKHEKLLEAQPDLVYSSFASFLTKEEAGDRKELHKLGVPTYLTEFDCTYHEAVADADFDLLFEEYRRLGRIMGVPEAGDKLADEQKAVVDKAVAEAGKPDEPLKAMWFYSTFEGTPWAAGPGGLPQHISELVGIENIYDDAKSKWAEVSWDETAARNPDVIILADLTRGEPNDTAKEKIALLKKDPLTRNLDAVKNNRFVTLPGSHMDPGYGSASAVPALVDGLKKLG